MISIHDLFLFVIYLKILPLEYIQGDAKILKLKYGQWLQHIMHKKISFHAITIQNLP